MTDDGLGQFEVTGRWVGFYRHRSERLGAFPITAEIRQEGSRIVGEMYDQITDRSEFLETILEDHRDDLSARDRILLENLFQQFGEGKVELNSHLPETSDIDGTINGGRLSFTKSYRGVGKTSWKVGGKEFSSVMYNDHKVHYAGHLDREKGVVGGEWTIRQRGWFGRFLRPAGRGSFELYRKS